MKTKKTIQKRLRKTKKGFIKRRRMNGAHLLSKHSNNVRRRKKKDVVSKSSKGIIYKLLKKIKA